MRFILLGISTFFLLFAHYTWAEEKENAEAGEAMDTLFVQWQKQETTVPFLSVSMHDFNLQSQQLKLVDSYGVGVISMGGGDLEEIGDWILAREQESQFSAFYVASLSEPFQIPFQGAEEWPSKTAVECLTDDRLVYDLGLLHGRRLIQAGMQIVEPVKIPGYYSDSEIHKIKWYTMGLKDSGLKFSLTKENFQYKKWLAWEDILFFQDAVDGNAKSKLKQRKRFRKESGYQGFLVGRIEKDENLISKKNLFWQGINVVQLGKNWVQELPKIQTDQLAKNGDVRRTAKFYFKNWRELQLHEPLDMMPPLYENLGALIDDQSTVLVNDKNGSVPVVELGSKQVITLLKHSETRARVDRYKWSKALNPLALQFSVESLKESIPQNALLLVDVSLLNYMELEKLSQLQDHLEVVAIHQGELEALKKYQFFEGLIYSSDPSLEKQLTLIETVFGVHPVSGNLPGYWVDGPREGEVRNDLDRLSYQIEDTPKIDFNTLTKIDSIVAAAIHNEEIPGCQVMMIKGGQVIYDKSFGYLTYDSLTHVRWDHVYDVASVTKVAATVPAMMREVESGRIKLEDHLGDQLNYFAETDKSDLTVQNILMHESGLKSYYPFWRKAHFDKVNSQFLYKERIGRRRYKNIKINWEDSVNAWIARSNFNSLKKQDSSFGYLYSDIGFMLMKEMAERNSGTRLDTLVSQMIYEPMAMDHTFYNPRNRISNQYLVPTARDQALRKEQLVGKVHDKNAALLGGVSGHAGLFANANDLAKFMQMMMQKGYYGGKYYFDAAVVDQFTAKVSEDHRRALGWDKPRASVSNCSKYASVESFGHSGFTGTLVWADPKYDLVYIFLSNRIYPDAQNYKLIENNTRTKIHDVMYESFISTYKFDNQDY